VAVVTGASSGIGLETARELSRRGWRCVLVARREERLRALAARLEGEAEVCDVGDPRAVESLAGRVLARHPRIDLLVNNAGMPARDTFVEADLDLVERVLAVNYLGGVWCTRAFLPGLAAARGSHVVNVVSVAGAVAFARSGPYAAAKHAQLAFSRSLRPALARHGIAVHTVLPGFVQTEGFSQAALLARRRSRWLVTDARRVAVAIVDAVEDGRAELTVPWFPYRPAAVAYGVAPGLVRRIERLMPGTPARAAAGAASRGPAGSGEGARGGSGGRGGQGRVAVVTGASSGIGAATARALARRGWRCVLVARRRELLERVAAESGGIAEPCDLLDRGAVLELGARLVAEYGSIGLLVNNAGALSRGTLDRVGLDELERVTRLNYLAGVWVTRALQPGLLRAGAESGAHIVNVASIGGAIAFPAGAAYSASKHAQVAFSRSLAAALRRTGVRVHTVMPGFVVTEGFPHPRFWESRLGRRFVVGPERVAAAVVAAVERGREETVVPWFPYRLAPIAQALSPTLAVRVLALDSYRDVA